MKRILLAAVLIAISGCTLIHHRNQNPYEKPFYVQFLDNGRPLDRQIGRTVEALRANPNSVELHNQLGELLVAKGFPKDAAREFERAIDLDHHFYQGWYNLGLVRASMGDFSGARRAFNRTVSIQKGHAEALFQLGLMEEKGRDAESAIDFYAKALRHNPDLIYPRINPRVLDSKLIHLAMLQNYDVLHARVTADFKPAPAGYVQPAPPVEPAPAGAAPSGAPSAPSPQAAPKDIVTPAPPATSPAIQTPPPTVTTVPSATAPPRTTT